MRLRGANVAFLPWCPCPDSQLEASDDAPCSVSQPASQFLPPPGLSDGPVWGYTNSRRLAPGPRAISSAHGPLYASYAFLLGLPAVPRAQQLIPTETTTQLGSAHGPCPGRSAPPWVPPPCHHSPVRIPIHARSARAAYPERCAHLTHSSISASSSSSSIVNVISWRR
jgi:hypothetical protein